MLSRVRLDAPQHALKLRAYREPVDTAAPLSAMTLDYDLVGDVVIVGEHALVSATHGSIAREALRDFEEALRQHGVRFVHWERHRADGSIKHVTWSIA